MLLLRLYRDSFAGLSPAIWWLALITLINRSGTMVLPFLTIYLTQALDFSLQQAGWVMSCFGLGSVAGSYLGGYFTDRVGYYRVMFWTLFLSGGAFLLLMLVKTMLWFCLAVFLLSLIADGFRPASMASIAAYAKPENRTRSLSLIRMAINTGWSIGPASESFFQFNLFEYFVNDFVHIFSVLVGSGMALGLISSVLAVSRYLRV